MEDFFEEPYRFGQPSKINPKTKYRTKEKDFISVIRTAEENRNRILDQSVDDLTLMFSGIKVQEFVSKEEENFSQLNTQINQLEDSLGEPIEAPSPTLTEKTKNAMNAFLFSMNKSIVYSIAFVKNSTPDFFSILAKYVFYLFKFMVYLSRASLLEKAFFILVLSAINKTTWGNMFLSFIYFIIKRISQFGWGVIKRQYGEEIMKLYNEVMESVKAIGVTTSAGYLASTFAKQLVSDSSFQGIVTETVSTAIHSQVPGLIQQNNAVLQEGLKAVIYSNEFKSILLASYTSTQLPEQIENFQNFLIASNRQHEYEIEKITSILYRIEQGDNTLVKQLQKYGLVNLPVLTKSAKKILELTGFIPTQHPQVELIDGGRRKRRTHKKGKRLSTRTRKGGRRSRVKRTHKRKF